MRQWSYKLAETLLLPLNLAAVIFLGLYTTIWGLWVVAPWWEVFNQAQLYHVLATVAPEWFWGGIAVTCGLFILYGALKPTYGPLVRGSSVAFWHWFMITIFYFMGDPFNTGGITALAFALYSAFVYLNIRVNFKNDRQSPQLLRHNVE